VIGVADQTCPCCSGAVHKIGEDVAERLDLVPAQFRVLVVRRPKYACRRCVGTVLQAPAPPRLIEGGLPTEALVAHAIVTKYADCQFASNRDPLFASNRGCDSMLMQFGQTLSSDSNGGSLKCGRGILSGDYFPLVW
jgi:hypothetical protein